MHQLHAGWLLARPLPPVSVLAPILFFVFLCRDRAALARMVLLVPIVVFVETIPVRAGGTNNPIFADVGVAGASLFRRRRWHRVCWT